MTEILTKAEVLKRIDKFCKPYVNYTAAAKAANCTVQQLSAARLDRIPPPPGLLKKIGVERVPLYAIDVENKHLDGSMAMD